MGEHEKEFLEYWIKELNYQIDDDETQLTVFENEKVALELKKQVLSDVMLLHEDKLADFRNKVQEHFDLGDIYEDSKQYRSEEHYQKVAEIQERIQINKVVIDHVQSLLNKENAPV